MPKSPRKTFVRPPFNYTMAQWQKIVASLPDRLRPSLTAQVRDHLEKIADEYLSNVEHRSARSKEVRRWKSVTKRAESLRRTMQALSRFDEAGELTPHLKALSDLASLGELATDWYKTGLRRICWVPNIPLKKSDLLKVKCADLDHNAMGTPALKYYSDLLDVWTTCVGGELSTWWDDLNNEVRGNLVPFFIAAAQPVMGRRTPSILTLPRIVRRHAALWRKLVDASPAKVIFSKEPVEDGQFIVSLRFEPGN